MPNRILRDYTDSAKFDGISAEAERLFNRLIVKVDDFGRFHADPRLVKAACFPLSEDLRANTVAAWLTQLSDRQLVFCYTSGTGQYLAIIKFRQRLRANVSKFPPPDGQPIDWHPPDDGQMTVTCQSNDGQAADIRMAYSESESESGGERRETESNIRASALMGRIGSWFNRRQSTVWSDRERKALGVVLKLNTPEEDIAALETRYKSGDPYLRRDILTLLNNWNGEIDRAKNTKGSNEHGNNGRGRDGLSPAAKRNATIGGHDEWLKQSAETHARILQQDELPPA
jgi:hypothetical protein